MRKLLYHPLLLALGIAVAPHGAWADVLFVPSTTSDTIVRVGSSGLTSPAPLANLNNPVAVVYDGDGNAYVSDSGSNSILKFPVGGGAVVTMAANVLNPTGLAIDGSGNLYAAVAADATVLLPHIITFSANSFAQYGTSFAPTADLQGIAFEPSTGDLFVANKAENKISRIAHSNAAVSDFSSSVTAPVGVAFNPAGKLFIADQGPLSSGRLITFNGNSGNPRVVQDQVGSDVRGLGFDAAGNAYIPIGSGSVEKVAPIGTLSTFASGITGAGLLAVRSASTTVISKRNDIAAQADNAAFASFGTPAINNNGSTAYRANLILGTGAPTAVSSSNNAGIWLQAADGSEQLLVRKGSVDITTGLGWNAFSDPVLNNHNGIGFRSILIAGIGGAASGNLVSLWSKIAGTTTLVARQGSFAPGLAPGIKFAGFSSFGLSDNNGMVFVASLLGSGVTLYNNTGIWAQDDEGTVLLIRRKGDFVSVDGVSKKLTAFYVLRAVPYVGGQTRSFNAAGDISYLAKFSDGTQAILRVVFP